METDLIVERAILESEFRNRTVDLKASTSEEYYALYERLLWECSEECDPDPMDDLEGNGCQFWNSDDLHDDEPTTRWRINLLPFDPCVYV